MSQMPLFDPDELEDSKPEDFDEAFEKDPDAEYDRWRDDQLEREIEARERRD